MRHQKGQNSGRKLNKMKTRILSPILAVKKARTAALRDRQIQLELAYLVGQEYTRAIEGNYYDG